MDINIESQIVVQTSAQWVADNTVYSAKRILVTSDAYYGSTDQRKFKIADGVQTWSQLDYMTLVQNGATNGYIPKSNGTDLVNSILQEYASGLKITNDKFLANTTTDAAVYWDVDYISLVGIGGTFNGYESIYISPSEFGLKSSINNFLVSEVARMILKHDTKVEIDTPTILLTQGTASKFLKTDASKNITYVDSPVDVNTIGSAINGALSATPNDTDLVMSVDTSVAKKNTWTQIKAFLKTYFDTVYQATGLYLTSANITQTITNGVTDKAPSEDAVFDALALKLDANSSLIKGFVLQGAVNSHNPADAITYYFADANIGAGTTASGQVRLYIPKTATLKAATVFVKVAGTLGSNEQGTIAVRLNNTTDIVISSTVTWDAATALVSNYSLNQAVTQGDYVEFKIVSPTWVTNPTTVSYTASLYFE